MHDRLLLVIITLFISACESSDIPSKTQEQIEPSQTRFAEEKARIEKENKAQQELLNLKRSFVEVVFVSVDEEQILVNLVNNSEKNIDNLSGSLDILDSDGNYVTSIALTNWVPGDIYLPAGESTLANKMLANQSDADRMTIIANAANYQYFYTTMRYQYEGEDEVNLNPIQDINTSTQDTALVKVQQPEKPKNPFNPQPCSDNQETIITPDEYYPGSVCEHINRNVASETSKKEYFTLCASNTIARIEVASCLPASGRPGIVYNKQLCCTQ